jgi:hypothetical protein
MSFDYDSATQPAEWEQWTMASTIHRTAASQALAKAIAFHQAGNAAKATEWAQRLFAMLRDAGIHVSVNGRPE